MFVFLVFTLALVALLGFLDYELQAGKKSLSNLRSIRLFSTLYFWILFLPSIDFSSSIILCNSAGQLEHDPTLACWSGLHFFYVVLFALTFLLQLSLCLVLALFNNEVRPTHTDALTRLDANLELKLLVIRVKLVLLSHHTAQYPMLHWLTLVVHGLTAAYLVRGYYQQLPYYNKRVSVVFCACCLGYAWVVANCFLVKICETWHYSGQMIPVVLGLVLVWLTARYVRDRRVSQVMVLKHQEKLRDDLELDQFVNNFENFVREQEEDSQVQMMFLGFLFLHKEECLQASCPLKHNNALY